MPNKIKKTANVAKTHSTIQFDVVWLKIAIIVPKNILEKLVICPFGISDMFIENMFIYFSVSTFL